MIVFILFCLLTTKRTWCLILLDPQIYTTGSFPKKPLLANLVIKVRLVKNFSK